MHSPFPGMDPYLETPWLWPDVHHTLISNIQGALNLALRPHYVARVVLRVYISDKDDPGREAILPDGGGAHLLDDEIKEARIEIQLSESGKLVTVIEVLSPTNKIPGSRGRASFMEKRREILDGPVHWVEIDLLRSGDPSVTRLPLVPRDYRILVSPGEERTKWLHWPFSVRQALPAISVPLLEKDPDVPLDLATVFRAAYEQGAYDLSVDYRKEPDPPLDAKDASWADRLLRDCGLRADKKR